MAWKKQVTKKTDIKKLEEDVKKKMEKHQKELEELEKQKAEEEALEETENENTDDKTEKFQVVKELPVQEVRKVKDEEGNIINLVTIEEALTEIMNS